MAKDDSLGEEDSTHQYKFQLQYGEVLSASSHPAETSRPLHHQQDASGAFSCKVNIVVSVVHVLHVGEARTHHIPRLADIAYSIPRSCGAPFAAAEMSFLLNALFLMGGAYTG